MRIDAPGPVPARLVGGLSLVCLAAGLLLPATATPVTATATEPCQTRRDAHVMVSSDAHRLWLCAGYREVKSYSVRLARKGPGKRQAGDAMLPLGTYMLGAPRESKKFGLFIPIRYPTPQQAAQGYTGDGVGIHGPHRALRWLGRLVNTFDTTAGCVGLATDHELSEIADFVRERHARRITIR